MPGEVWLVVVNWNGAALLPACLAALGGLPERPRVVVVDNGSTDDSAQVVSRFPGVEWAPLGANHGFAEANNVALRRALAGGARWIGLVNPDVRVEPDWLGRLRAAGEANPDVGLLQGLLLFEDRPGVVNSTGIEVDALGRGRDRDFDVPLAELSRPDGTIVGATGGAVLLRAEMLRAAGLFDPAYFAYYEDLDLSLRAARAGWRAYYVSGARAYHGYGRSFERVAATKRHLLARNHVRVVAANLPFPLAAAVAPTLVLARAVLQAPLELALGHPELALAQLRGAGAGALAAAQVLAERVRGRRIPPGADV